MMKSFSCPRSCPMANERWCRFRPITDKLGPVQVNSHVAEIDVTITDLAALEIAAQRCGLEFRWDKKTYHWFGQSVGDYPLPEGMTVDQLGKCDHAIGVPLSLAAYEVGVIAKDDGTYKLVWDFFAGGNGLMDRTGEKCAKLLAEYSVAVAQNAANQQGWAHERTQDGGLLIYHPLGGTLTVAPGGTLETSGFVGHGCHDALMQLGMPMKNLQAKPEYSQVAAEVMVTG